MPRRAPSPPVPTSSSSGPTARCSRATRPVLAVGATRTGAGKSQTTRYLAALLAERGLKPVVIRHPMPYGDLAAQRVQRYRDPRRPRSTTRPRSRSARSTSRTSTPDASCMPASTTTRSSPGRERGRRHPVGRRQQRLPVLPARPVHRRRRPAAPGRRAPLSPGRDQRADGRRRDHQQGRLGRRRRRSSRPRRPSHELNPRAESPARALGPDARRAADRGQARRRRRGRPHAHPRRHALRRRRSSPRDASARLACRPAAGRRRLDQRRPRAIPGARAARPGDGLRTGADRASSRRRSTPSTRTWSCRRRRST